MAHAVADDPDLHMGMPLTHGKLAMWLFLVTEIMFFTALIGTYLLLRNGQPTGTEPWPTPHDVHLAEWAGAGNTLVLICSSLCVVLAHYYLHTNQVGKATRMIFLTFLLGCVFMCVKAWEYSEKFSHGILPGRVHEKLDGDAGYRYVRAVKEQLEHIVHEGHTNDKAKSACRQLLEELPNLSPRDVNLRVAGLKYVSTKKIDLPKRALTPAEKVDLLKADDKLSETEMLAKYGILGLDSHLHLSYAIPYGNLWASCYFALTGFHALHVLGGLVIFVIMMIMAGLGSFGPQHEGFVENVGLYWHFVDIVWIFLFPLLYLV